MVFKTDISKARREEFEREALPHLSHLYTAAYYLTKNKTEAEDLVQDTYLRAFRFFDKFQPGTNCRAWLLSIQRRLAINRYCHKKRGPETVDWAEVELVYDSMVEQGERANPESLLFSMQTYVDIERTLKKLPEEFRMALVLVDIQELTYEEAAQVMRCPIGTIRSRVSRGRRLLQVRLKGLWPGKIGGRVEKTGQIQPALRKKFFPERGGQVMAHAG